MGTAGLSCWRRWRSRLLVAIQGLSMLRFGDNRFDVPELDERMTLEEMWPVGGNLKVCAPNEVCWTESRGKR